MSESIEEQIPEWQQEYYARRLKSAVQQWLETTDDRKQEFGWYQGCYPSLSYQETNYKSVYVERVIIPKFEVPQDQMRSPYVGAYRGAVNMAVDCRTRKVLGICIKGEDPGSSRFR